MKVADRLGPKGEGGRRLVSNVLVSWSTLLPGLRRVPKVADTPTAERGNPESPPRSGINQYSSDLPCRVGRQGPFWHDVVVKHGAGQPRGRAILGLFDEVVTASNVESNRMGKTYGLGDVSTVPNSIRIETENSARSAPGNGKVPVELLFVGNLDYPPNQDAVDRLVLNIFPKVREQHGDALLHIVGGGGGRMPAARDGVHFHGRIKTLDPFYDRAMARSCTRTNACGPVAITKDGRLRPGWTKKLVPRLLDAQQELLFMCFTDARLIPIGTEAEFRRDPVGHIVAIAPWCDGSTLSNFFRRRTQCAGRHRF